MLHLRMFFHVTDPTEHFLHISLFHLTLPDYVSALMSAPFVIVIASPCCPSGCGNVDRSFIVTLQHDCLVSW
jgi:hypothetical protein